MREVGLVLGVDTHKDVHVATLVDDVGQLVAMAQFAASDRGGRQMLAWAERHGSLRRAGVKGPGATAIDSRGC